MGNCCLTTLSVSEPTLHVSEPTLHVSEPTLPEKGQNDIQLVILDKKEEDPYKDSTYENTPEYTLNNLRQKVKILRVLDGDTVDIALYHEASKHIYRHRVRLYGIDTPEKRPSLLDPNRQAEIAASLRAKQALEQRVKENDFILVALFYQTDKYGRQMCTFYDKNGDDINQWMIQQGHAYEYHGKTKKKFNPNSDATA
jgi:micrococcal nuclease